MIVAEASASRVQCSTIPAILKRFLQQSQTTTGSLSLAIILISGSFVAAMTAVFLSLSIPQVLTGKI